MPFIANTYNQSNKKTTFGVVRRGGDKSPLYFDTDMMFRITSAQECNHTVDIFHLAR
ncbi:Uncharacterised protein [Serratia marcescens]|nr:Uncharacterised protein [Serratia marcescens]